MKTKIYLDKITPDEIIKRLQKGEKVYCSNPDTVYYKLVNNYICRFENNKCTNIGVCLTINCYYYFKEKIKSIKFEVGKHYKTRKGTEAVCYAYNKCCFIPYKFIELNTEVHINTYEDGKLYSSITNDLDIVDYWKD